MSFLVLLLMLWVEKFSAWRWRIQQDGLWLRGLAKVQGDAGLAASPWLGLALLVLLPVLLLGLLLAVLQPLAYGWLALPVHVLVLVYSLGRGDVQSALGPFRDAWRRGDSQAAYHVAERDLGLAAEEGEALLLRVQDHLLWQAYQSFFAVIFWYALLGPLAALAYRLLALAGEHAEQPALRERAQQLRHGFDWLPVRVLTASFALVGNFVAVSRALLQDLLNWDISAAQVVVTAGRAAGELSPPLLGEAGVASLDELWQLLVRAAMLWYAGFALWTLLL
ncbi:MAG: regulatory signaling modulator protein AmpE [Pseudomonadota bacterium]